MIVVHTMLWMISAVVFMWGVVVVFNYGGGVSTLVWLSSIGVLDHYSRHYTP